MVNFKIGERVKTEAFRQTNTGHEKFDRLGTVAQLSPENYVIFINFDDGKDLWCKVETVARVETPAPPLSLFGDDELPQHTYGRNGR